jgi:hypothetical protein
MTAPKEENALKGPDEVAEAIAREFVARAAHLRSQCDEFAHEELREDLQYKIEGAIEDAVLDASRQAEKYTEQRWRDVVPQDEDEDEDQSAHAEPEKVRPLPTKKPGRPRKAPP